MIVHIQDAKSPKQTWDTLIKMYNTNYRNPSLGLMTKARPCKGIGQEGSPRVWESVRMNIHTPK
jgi:hypothetical protein